MSTQELSINDIETTEVDLGMGNDPETVDDRKLSIDDKEISAPSRRNTDTDNDKLEEKFNDLSKNLDESGPEQVDVVLDLVRISDEKLDELTLEDSEKSVSCSVSCVMDLPPEFVPRLANQHAFKTTYRLTNDEIEHSTLNPQVPLTGQFERPSTRYRQQSVPNSREKINRDSLPGASSKSQYRQSQNLEHSRESVNRADLPGPNNVRRRAASAQSNRSNLENAAHGVQDNHRNSERNRTNEVPSASSGFSRPARAFNESKEEPQGRRERWFRMTIEPRVTISRPRAQPQRVRWVNHNPFFHIDRIFAGMPGLFGFNRGFDEDGHFFFGVTIPRQQEGSPKATNEQIEKAVSQLKKLSSDMEIKEDDKCPICLDEFSPNDDIVEMPCPCKRTFFHRQCAVETLEKTKKIKCPNCRKWDGDS